MTTLDIGGLIDAVASHALASGYFEQVNQHEPANRPGNGLTAAVWVDALAASRSSGLGSASASLTFFVRLYTSMVQEPRDMIDPNLTAACDALLRAYVSHFTLAGAVRQVDVLGAYGPPLGMRAGYIQQDGALLRVLTISLPVIINDLWDEVP